MPKKGESTAGVDVGGGLETVAGVVDEEGLPVQNYAPSFAHFTRKLVVGVPEASFKFYKKTGTGHVH